MQTARRVQEHTQHFPDHDMVLEQLIMEGTFDQVDPNMPDVREELAMNHTSAMVQRLLMRIENVESQVSYLGGGVCLIRFNLRWFLSCTTPMSHSMNSVLM